MKSFQLFGKYHYIKQTNKQNQDMIIFECLIFIFFFPNLSLQLDEKMKTMQEKLEYSEQKLTQSLRKAEALPTVEAELAERMAALSQVS